MKGEPVAQDFNPNTLYYGDCLDWMREWEADCVDLIYLDPPFNSNANYNVLFGAKGDGKAQYRAFNDTWHWDAAAAERYAEFENAPGRPAHDAMVGLRRILGRCGMLAYLTYMAERLEEMRRLLKPTGSIYLHCNQFASHYLKIVMDAVFGKQNFINEVVWNYGTPSGGRASGKKPVKVHDYLLAYASSYGKHLYNRQYTPYSEKYVRDWFRHKDEDGRMYQTRSRKGTIVRQYLDESPGVPLSTVWSDIMQLSSRRGWFPNTNREETGYPTQKPLALLERIIEASSHEGDLVLDPFCGCGTAVEAAGRLNRRWAGVDISSFAIDLVRKRLKDESIPVKGIPADLSSARKLAREKPFEFESWAVTRLPGFAPNTKQVADGGVDGRGMLFDQPDDWDSRLALAQVKGGRFSASALRDFIGVVERGKAAIGRFITLEPVASADANSRAAELGSIAVLGQSYRRLRLWSIDDYFNNRPCPLPPMTNPYTGKLMQQGLF
ncbi:MAG: DNA methyltransferase [Candidatus Poribacteria bacterium]|nr:DNA methyltransferase [Candidatus Poribacteria bacterium]